MDRARILVADNDARAETEIRQQRLGRITFRAWRRGFREADLVLGPFMEREGASLSDADLDAAFDLAWYLRHVDDIYARFGL